MKIKRRPRRQPITAAEAGRRAWKGTTKAERAEIMRQRVFARWHFPCGQRRNRWHNTLQCQNAECPGRKEAP